MKIGKTNLNDRKMNIIVDIDSLNTNFETWERRERTRRRNKGERELAGRGLVHDRVESRDHFYPPDCQTGHVFRLRQSTTVLSSRAVVSNLPSIPTNSQNKMNKSGISSPNKNEIRRLIIVNHGETTEKVFGPYWMKFYDDNGNLKYNRATATANYSTIEDGNLPASVISSFSFFYFLIFLFVFSFI